MMGPEADIDDAPGAVGSVGNSFEDASNVVAMSKFLFEALSLLLHLGIDVLLLRCDSFLQLLNLGLEGFELVNVGFQLGGKWSNNSVEISFFGGQG